MRALNRELLRFQVLRAMKRLGFSKVINWIFNPAASIIGGALGEDMLIYYCVDEYTAFSDVPTASLIQLENELLRKADLVIVSAERLLQSKRQHNPRTVLVRHGVDHAHFAKALLPETPVRKKIASNSASDKLDAPRSSSFSRGRSAAGQSRILIAAPCLWRRCSRAVAVLS